MNILLLLAYLGQAACGWGEGEAPITSPLRSQRKNPGVSGVLASRAPAGLGRRVLGVLVMQPVPHASEAGTAGEDSRAGARL